jgi:carbamoylphosphate synthase large subunit
LPFLKGKYFIETTLLSDLKKIPEDLENYVLKPLFSFSGTGVIFHVKKEDIEAVVEKDLYILQKKVNYIPIVQSPDGKVKAEVRLLCIWKKEDTTPTLLCNLVRLSRGEMIGVKFNKDKDWVGGTLGLFEKQS